LDEGARTRVHQRLAKRVEAVGGVIDIDSGRESGTEIKITVAV
jgi:signal transduction histidine kinase